MRTAIAVFALIAVLCGAVGSSAQIPETISYQGVLKGSGGENVPDDDYDITLALYDVDVGGTALWSETQTLAVANGIFNAMLGAATPLALPFDQQYWLGVAVDADPELAPRVELASAPYAYRALYVDGAGDITGVEAGDGLAGGGTEGDVVVDVVPGTGLEIAADAVGLTAPYADGSAFDGEFVNEGQADAVTTDMLVPDVVSSVDGVVSDGGDIDLVAGSNITITPDDDANTITIASSGTVDDGDWIVSGDDVYRTTGKVGVGTSTPRVTFHGHGGLGSGLLLTNDATGSATSDGLKLEVDGSGHAYLRQQESANLNMLAGGGRVTVFGNGMVGVNRSSAMYDLDVGGTARMEGLELPTGASNGHVLTSDSDGTGTWQPVSGPLSVDGVVNDGGDIDLVAGSNITITPDDGANTITIAATAADDGDWTVSGDDLYRLDGDVGIGTATPTAKLDVVGSIAANNIGSTFIRWGNGTAPAGSELVYSGFGFASFYGGQAQLEPIVIQGGDPGPYLSPTDGLLYPLTTHNDLNLLPGNVAGSRYVPAAVCYSASPTLVIWGSQTAPAGWEVLYRGYVVGSHYSQTGPTTPLCLDCENFDNGYSCGSNLQALIYPMKTNGWSPTPAYPLSYMIKCAVVKKQ